MPLLWPDGIHVAAPPYMIDPLVPPFQARQGTVAQDIGTKREGEATPARQNTLLYLQPSL